MTVETPPDEEPKTERFNMFISKSELQAIDEWAWENRVRSKSEAVRRLVAIGLRADAGIRSISSESSHAYQEMTRFEGLWRKRFESNPGENGSAEFLMRTIARLACEFPKVADAIARTHIRALNLEIELAPFSFGPDITEAEEQSKDSRKRFDEYWKNYTEKLPPRIYEEDEW